MKLSVEKRSGVLLHPTSLPGGHGIGDLGPESYKFIDHLSDMGQSLWQVLPLGPTDQFNSPYSSISTFAGNHLLISLDLLVEANLLKASAIKTKPSLNSNRVNFKDVIAYKAPLLKQVSKDFNTKASTDMRNRFEDFKDNNSYWLDGYSLFCANKEANQHRPWMKWKEKNLGLKECIDQAMVLQFLFHDQWQSLHRYCKGKGVQVIGDMPIYVDHDSSDVYSNRHLFNLDENGRMIYQSGAPPCDFQKNGQLWGTPVYNWDKHEEEQYKWWIQRFKKLFQMVDIIRLDHFIGYAKFYRILTKNKTAVNGEWLRGPGTNFFDTVLKAIKTFNVIVEDLGDVTQDVIELRDRYRFPGMKVFQFEADSMQHSKDCDSNSFFCTGTHDNDTIMGWFKSLPKQRSDHNELSQDSLLNFFNCNKENIHWKMINYTLRKSSKFVVVPMQDLFAEDSRARFNVPGTLSNHNWSWRMKPNQLTDSIKNKLEDLTKNIRN